MAVAEGAKELRLLLSWCDLQNVLELADKYSMDAIVANVEEIMLRLEVIVSEPLRLFCIAARFQLQTVVRAAVLNVLNSHSGNGEHSCVYDCATN